MEIGWVLKHGWIPPKEAQNKGDKGYYLGKQEGIKEVVAFLNNTSMDAHTLVFQVSEREWQAKLKEWGVG